MVRVDTTRGRVNVWSDIKEIPDNVIRAIDYVLISVQNALELNGNSKPRVSRRFPVVGRYQYDTETHRGVSRAYAAFSRNDSTADKTFFDFISEGGGLGRMHVITTDDDELTSGLNTLEKWLADGVLIIDGKFTDAIYSERIEYSGMFTVSMKSVPSEHKWEINISTELPDKTITNPDHYDLVWENEELTDTIRLARNSLWEDFKWAMDDLFQGYIESYSPYCTDDALDTEVEEFNCLEYMYMHHPEKANRESK